MSVFGNSLAAPVLATLVAAIFCTSAVDNLPESSKAEKYFPGIITSARIALGQRKYTLANALLQDLIKEKSVKGHVVFIDEVKNKPRYERMEIRGLLKIAQVCTLSPDPAADFRIKPFSRQVLIKWIIKRQLALFC